MNHTSPVEPNVWSANVTPARSDAADSMSKQEQRIYYLDNVRALAMMLGVFFHGALAYSALGHTFWIIGDREGSLAISTVTWFSHLFRMGLFFLIAGYFAKLLIQKRGVKKFLVNRGLRITLPFLIFLPLVTIAMIMVFVFAAWYVKEPPPVLAIIISAIKGTPVPAGQESNDSLGHLWFLYYLMMFAVLSAAFCRFKWSELNRVVDRLYTTPASLVFLPLLLLPGIILTGTPAPAPGSFIPALWPFLFYGLFYWAGWCLRGREQTLDAVAPYAWGLLAISVVMYVPYYMYFPVQSLVTGHTPELWQLWLTMILSAFIAVYMTIACLGLGKRYLSKPSRIMRFVSDSSYWVYIVHLPLIMFIQVLMVDWHMNVWVKLLISVSGTFAISLLTYVIFVRYTPIGWMLNGRKRTQKVEAIVHTGDSAVAVGESQLSPASV